MPVTLADGQRLEVFQGSDPNLLNLLNLLILQDWIALVGTRWLPEQILQRLVGAWIPCLFQGDELVATCVLRPVSGLWILETLRARKGFGTPFLRSMVVWLYKHTGPFSLGYTWELSLVGLLGAWSRGWLTSAVQIQYGWSWSPICGFCSKGHHEPRFIVPTVLTTERGTAVVSDSGLQDGWGHVQAYRGEPDWTQVAEEGRWRSLWMRASETPPGWTWTGEWVVVGILNQIHGSYTTKWSTAEI